MKIYCVHDRLINYWLTPLTASDDAAMKHSLSTVVNNDESQHAITQAPHHYDLYKLGEIKEDGQIQPCKEFICTASDLIRARPGSAAATSVQARGPGVPGPENSRMGPTAQGEDRKGDQPRNERAHSYGTEGHENGLGKPQSEAGQGSERRGGNA